MNFLQLCQQAREDCGISGTGPTSVSNQSGEYLRIVNWVNKAWEDIQNWNENWEWMRKEFTLQTVASQREYLPSAAVTDHSRWHGDTLRIYKTAEGQGTEQYLAEMGYEDFRNSYQFGAMNTLTGRPMVFAERPRDLALLLGAIPDGVYTVYGEYQQAAQRMVANADVPGGGAFPAEFHQMIVDRAVMKYAAFEGAGALYGTAQVDFKERMRGLEKAKLPSFSYGEALA